jgi:hypothetical protein
MNDITREELKEFIKTALDEVTDSHEALIIRKSKDGIPWDTIFKISQIAIFPALGVIFYMLTQLGNLDRRVTVTELIQSSRPNFVSMAEKTAVIEERQRVNTIRIDSLEKTVEIHKSKSTYDKPR